MPSLVTKVQFETSETVCLSALPDLYRYLTFTLPVVTIEPIRRKHSAAGLGVFDEDGMDSSFDYFLCGWCCRPGQSPMGSVWWLSIYPFQHRCRPELVERCHSDAGFAAAIPGIAPESEWLERIAAGKPKQLVRRCGGL